MEMDASEKTQKLKAMKMNCILDLLVEGKVLIGTHFFNVFSVT